MSDAVSEPENKALRYDQRPEDPTPITTADLPPTPLRDRNIPATAWTEAPMQLLNLGNDLPDRPTAHCSLQAPHRALALVESGTG